MRHDPRLFEVQIGRVRIGTLDVVRARKLATIVTGQGAKGVRLVNVTCRTPFYWWPELEDLRESILRG